jgi:hypothetical protein
MAKQIIILTQSRDNGSSDRRIRFVFWIPVTQVNRRVPLPGASSAYTGATEPEIAEIQSGAVIELLLESNVPSGATANQVRTELEARYAAEAARIGALPNPMQFFGTTWDGTTWT